MYALIQRFHLVFTLWSVCEYLGRSDVDIRIIITSKVQTEHHAHVLHISTLVPGGSCTPHQHPGPWGLMHPTNTHAQPERTT